MNKKAFTLVELLGVIIILAILFTFAFFSYARNLRTSKEKVLKININSIEDAALAALTDCSKGTYNTFCNKYSIPEPGSSIKILYSDLVDANYVNRFKDPYNKDVFCDLDGDSYVEVTRKTTNNTLSGTVDKSDISFTYVTCLKCGDLSSKSRISMAKILKDKGLTNNAIMTCTGLTQNVVENLD